MSLCSNTVPWAAAYTFACIETQKTLWSSLTWFSTLDKRAIRNTNPIKLLNKLRPFRSIDFQQLFWSFSLPLMSETPKLNLLSIFSLMKIVCRSELADYWQLVQLVINKWRSKFNTIDLERITLLYSVNPRISQTIKSVTKMKEDLIFYIFIKF